MQWRFSNPVPSKPKGSAVRKGYTIPRRRRAGAVSSDRANSSTGKDAKGRATRRACPGSSLVLKWMDGGRLALRGYVLDCTATRSNEPR